MVAALGVNQKVAVHQRVRARGFPRSLGGALQIPRDACIMRWICGSFVDVFVVVVIGGLGSIIGAFVAAVLVSELNAFGF